MRIKLVFSGFILTIISLFFYSFTQVDLSLTLSRSSIYQTIEKYFQNVGYFQRPLSAQIYIGIVIFLFVFYLLLLRLAHKNMLSRRQVWGLIIVMSAILTFSYNGFSYDLFNYIFDAKIITHYGQNPYLHKALDFPGDPMLSFMHWTQRNYPYGPTWLAVTAPLSFLGMNVFLPTFFLFKAISTLAFLGTCYFIGKIISKTSPKKELFGLAFFAFNPLVIVESLVSSHNDILMLMFVVWALYLFMNKKYLRSSLLLILSIGVKFATVFIIPAFLLELIWARGFKKISYFRLTVLMCVFMIAAIVVASLRTNFQPWYLLYVIPFTAVIADRYYVLFPSIIMSISSLAIYIPFLSSGNWDAPIPMQLFWVTTAGVGISLLSVLIIRGKNLLE